MKQPKTIVLLPNGGVSARDEDGEQIPDLCYSWIQLYLEYLERQGIDPLPIYMEARMNDGRWKQIKPQFTTNGWNYSIEEKPE